MKSIWQDTVQLPHFPQLKKDIHTDVLIIGGGIAGILTAYYLHQAGVKYVLVEKNTICSGTTQNTTAKITYQHGFVYHKILKTTVSKRLSNTSVPTRERLTNTPSCAEQSTAIMRSKTTMCTA